MATTTTQDRIVDEAEALWRAGQKFGALMLLWRDDGNRDWPTEKIVEFGGNLFDANRLVAQVAGFYRDEEF